MKIRRKKLSQKPEEKNSAYAVGYGKPPQHIRYKPGQSGNPKGRPRGSKSKVNILRELLAQKVTVTQQERKYRMNKLTLILLTLVNKAASGDLRAVSVLQPMLDSMEKEISEKAQLSDELPACDKEILEEYVRRTKSTSCRSSQ